VGHFRIDQANVFYNYTIGLRVTDVDLVKTASNLLNSGLTRAVFLSDLKYLYVDDHARIKLELVQQEGRRWDPGWKVSFGPDVPQAAATELAYSMGLLFHERRIEGSKPGEVALYLRAALPPIVLQSDGLTLPLYAWVKVFSDGIVILSFQLDATWDGIDEESWISTIVNLFRRYFDAVWVDERVQRLDAKQLLPNAFDDEMTIAGSHIGGRKVKKLVKKMRRRSQAFLDEALDGEGREFEIGNEPWILHEVAGSKQQEDWEASIDLCRSEYASAVAGLIISGSQREPASVSDVLLWEGRPSVSLIRFQKQPASKDTLLVEFGPSMSRILMRAAGIDHPPELPPDLRLFGDYCFHGNRAVLLWTWLRADGAPHDAWEDRTTHDALSENQVRAEHFEYHNMKVARACAIAGAPPSDRHLVEAYETLTLAEDAIHHSSRAGEVSDALAYLMSAVGTSGLVPSGKEKARWHLDERRYRIEAKRARADRWLGFVFGLVGAAGLADLVLKPYLVARYPDFGSGTTGLISFALAALAVGLLAVLLSLINRRASR